MLEGASMCLEFAASNQRHQQTKKHVGVLLIALMMFIYEPLPLAEGRSAESVTCPVVLPDEKTSLASRTHGLKRIVNGNVARNIHDYIAAVTFARELVCTATLLSANWALTAAHCDIEPGKHSLIIGGSNHGNGTPRGIKRVIRHELYRPEVEEYAIHDIQLIQLQQPAPPSSRFVKLNANPAIPANYAFVRAAGYGETLGTASPSYGPLRQVDVPVQSMKVCQQQYKKLDWEVIPSFHVCAGYIAGGCDSCFGDSGGPLFLFEEDMSLVQVGITSFGFQCALPGFSGVYTRVSSYIDWLHEKEVAFDKSMAGVNVFAPAGNEDQQKPGELGLDSADGGNGDENTTDVADYAEADSSPGETGNLPSCFPSEAVVTLEDGSQKEMRHVKVGDMVQVRASRFSKIFMFTHRVADGFHGFISISHTGSSTSLLLTEGHMLPLNGVMQAAGTAKVGDTVMLGDGRKAVVVAVRKISQRGLHNPQTLDGHIVVNGVVTSTYTTALSQSTAHALLAPLRYVFEASGGDSDISRGVFERRPTIAWQGVTEIYTGMLKSQGMGQAKI